MNEFESARHEEERRHMHAVMALIMKHPERRFHACSALLGAAIGTCDTFGYDAESFIASLRANTMKPDGVLVPPKEGQS